MVEVDAAVVGAGAQRDEGRGPGGEGEGFDRGGEGDVVFCAAGGEGGIGGGVGAEGVFQDGAGGGETRWDSGMVGCGDVGVGSGWWLFGMGQDPLGLEDEDAVVVAAGCEVGVVDGPGDAAYLLRVGFETDEDVEGAVPVVEIALFEVGVLDCVDVEVSRFVADCEKLHVDGDVWVSV